MDNQQAVGAPGSELVRTEHAAAELVPLRFDDIERDIIRKSFMPGASEVEAQVLIRTAERMRLDPFKKQIHFVKRSAYNDATGGYEDRWAFQTSIDGFRSRADETGEYDGTDEPVFTFEDRINPLTGEPLGAKELVARVTVHRRGRRPVTGVARWSEFVQKTRKGEPVRMWMSMPHHMLAKCAEALALRQAFPERLGGLYTDDEMVGGDEHEGGGDAKPKAGDSAKQRVTEQAERRKEKREAAGGKAEPVTVEAVDLGARAKEIAARLDAVKTPAEFNATWKPLTQDQHYEVLRAVPELAEAFKRNKARIWPDAAKPAEAAKAEAEPVKQEDKPAKPEPDPMQAKWIGDITRASGDEGPHLWNALNEAWQGNIPADVQSAFFARWPSETSEPGAGG